MKRHLIDLVERAGATFAQAFLASITLGPAVGITDLGALKIGGTAGAFSVAKFLLVKANAYLGTQPDTTAAPVPDVPAAAPAG